MAKNRKKLKHRRSELHNNNQKIIKKRKHQKNKKHNKNNKMTNIRNKQKRKHRRNYKRDNNKKNQKMFIDLSAGSDDGLALILLRVPAKDLIGKCIQVLDCRLKNKFEKKKRIKKSHFEIINNLNISLQIN